MTESKATGIFLMLVAIFILVLSAADDSYMLLVLSAINAFIAIYQFYVAKDDAE